MNEWGVNNGISLAVRWYIVNIFKKNGTWLNWSMNEGGVNNLILLSVYIYLFESTILCIKFVDD